MLRRFFIFVAALIAIYPPLPADAQPRTDLCSPEQFATLIYFGNGVEGGDSYEAQQPSRLLLENTLRAYVASHSYYDLPSDCQAVSIAFNKGNGLIRDLLQAGEQLIASDPSILARWLEATVLPDALVDAIVSVVHSRALQISADDPELIGHVTEYKRALNGGQRVAVLAHSQGNLYVNKALTQLTADLTAFSRFNVIALATPDSMVASDGPSITTYEDFAATALFWIVNPNREGPSRTNAPTLCTPLPGCHSFSSYLLGRRTGPLIMADLLDIITPFNTNPVAHISIDGVPTLRDGQTIARRTSDRVDISSEASSDSDGAVIGRQWYIDGRPVSTSSIMTFGDVGPGEYLVNLVVYDYLGASSAPATLIIVVDIDAPLNRQPRAGFTMSVPGHVALNDNELHVAADAQTGEAQVTFQDQSSDPNGLNDIVSRVWTVNTRTDALSVDRTSFLWGFTPGGPYIVTLTVRDSGGLTSSASGTIYVAPPNQPPTAGFSMSVPGQIATDGGELHTVVDVHTGKAVVSFTDRSADPDGHIISRRWTSDTGLLLSEGLSSFDWGFGPGRYVITLTVEDDGHATASSSGVVEVLGPTPTLLHADTDPRVYYGPPLVAADGTIYVSRSTGSWLVELQRVDPAGGGWIAPADVDTLAPRTLAFGPDGRVYFAASRSTLFAYRPDGTIVSGWPARITEAFNPYFRTVLVDDDTGQVHLAALGVYVADPTADVTLNADGTEAWRVPDSDAGSMLRGPGADIYIQKNDVVRFDRQTGAERCRSTPPYYESFTLGTSAGLFGSRYWDIYRFNGDCTYSTFYSALAPYVTAVSYDDGNGVPESARLIVLEYTGDLFHTTGSLLTGVTLAGILNWRQPDIETPAVVATRPGKLYVSGLDALDNRRQKLFVVDAATGSITVRIDTSDTCGTSGCNFGVGPQGDIYITTDNRIYRVQ
jgi:PKD repeat protein